MKTIKLSRGLNAIIDDEWYPMLSLVCWHATDNKRGNHYASRSFNGNQSESMHRVILGAGKNDLVDHINGNGLDNRLCNLRLCDATGNNVNIAKQKRKTSSIYKGVVWRSKYGKWLAQAGGTRRKKHLGHFDSEEDAARAYNEYAVKTWGEFSRLNIINGDEE